MSVKEAPLAKVKRLHGTKEKLVDSLVDSLAKDSDESKGELKDRLLGISNKKLLRLSETLARVDKDYGGRDGLVEAVAKARGKSKDADYKTKLENFSIIRLLDMTRAKKAS